jgi:hypothetical protein
MIKKNIFSIITALIILFLSFAKAETFSMFDNLGVRQLDKLVHACMYFAFMLVLLYENRLAVKNTGSLFILAIIPFIFGTLIEFCQSWFTLTRKGDFFDAFSNLIGIFFAIATWLLFQKFSRKKY